MGPIIWIDTEVSPEQERICDLGAVKEDHTCFHSPSLPDFLSFLKGASFLCGHQILRHDLKYIQRAAAWFPSVPVMDTLFLSPLLFPRKPYHALLKDDKLQSDELNNPVNDCLKAEKLFWDEINAWRALEPGRRQVYRTLLQDQAEFAGFMQYAEEGKAATENTEALIQSSWRGLICENTNLAPLIRACPIELSYALALIGARDSLSITPPWVLRNYPRVENTVKYLCGTPCAQGCAYCRAALDIHKGLKKYFGYQEFRTFNGEPLQEQAAQAAMDGKSLLAVFPTGGGKSITFQLPALLQGAAVHGLTVVISPLQSLMKDQVDHLSEAGITGAVTINGLMSPIERADACRRVLDGTAELLFISPEQLRSRTIEKMLLSRNVIRFVIDEAHCFSAWGQDFRVDYLYIGDFIHQLLQQKNDRRPIAVSCFTATAKPKVISDIRDYFQQKLGLNLELFASPAERENLHYTVLFRETDEEKYIALRQLIAEKSCPAIVYVSRTRRTREIADRLVSDGFPARPFHGKMPPSEKIENQDSFLRNETRVIVATSAFGMGVDKKDVGLVIHYDISDSLENYIQEAGRAGRDASLQAECYVLYNNSDLDKHFILLNQTRLSLSEIQQVWRAVKDLTRSRPTVCCSPLEIARQAGWETTGPEMETRIKTAINALENAGYIRRGKNMPHVYASGIQASNMTEAGSRIRTSALFTDSQRQTALRILQFLISRRSISRAGNDEAESRIDYLSDILGLEKKEVLESIHLMRREGLLSDAQDMSAWMLRSDSRNKSSLILRRFLRLEDFLLSWMLSHDTHLELKQINEAALQAGIATSSVRDLKTLLYYLTVKNLIQKEEDREAGTVETVLTMDVNLLWQKFRLRSEMSAFAVEALFSRAKPLPPSGAEAVPVQFSLLGLFQEFEKEYTRSTQLEMDREPLKPTLQDMEDALLYLSKIGAMHLEGGFLVLYNGMEIQRLTKDTRVRYKAEDYRLLDEFYQQKIQQIHIVGEYANMMVRDYQAALGFVRDYFQMDYRKFIARYFQGDRALEIHRNITPEKYHQLFGELSETQLKIIRDDESRVITVAAGPGSGKTRLLTHKLASLLLMEDVKHDQLLMLTFSRAAATVFKKRLTELIGNAAHFVDIKTFHSFCFDLLGKTGSLEGVRDVIPEAVHRIRKGEVEPGRIRKTVLVIDEAQDMDENEYDLIQALLEQNEEMRIIAVGDDDQNIYGFRGSDSRFFRALSALPGARQYEMTENYRSLPCIVKAANAFSMGIKNRMKKEEIRAVQQEEGKIRIIRHSGEHFEEALVRQLAEAPEGSSAILTSTNEEALISFTLLHRAGIPARLIQSLDGFRLSHLMELRLFTDYLDQNGSGPVISDELWARAIQAVEEAWPQSRALEACRNLWRDFEAVCPQRFRSDLEEFILESSLEDFYESGRQAVFVSTIHKAKGREFDRVLLLLKNLRSPDEEEMRRIYVGMTRARRELYIHCGMDLFPFPLLPGVETETDSSLWDRPADVTLQLTHRDVVLSFYMDKKNKISRLWAGMPLGISLPYLTADLNGRTLKVAKCSKACLEKIAALREKGYRLQSASIRFIVAWREKQEIEECWVILPDLSMSREE